MSWCPPNADTGHPARAACCAARRPRARSGGPPARRATPADPRGGPPCTDRTPCAADVMASDAMPAPMTATTLKNAEKCSHQRSTPVGTAARTRARRAWRSTRPETRARSRDGCTSCVEQHHDIGRCGVDALPQRPWLAEPAIGHRCAGDHARSSRSGDCRGGVGGAVVDDDHLGGRRRLRSRGRPATPAGSAPRRVPAPPRSARVRRRRSAGHPAPAGGGTSPPTTRGRARPRPPRGPSSRRLRPDPADRGTRAATVAPWTSR